MSWTPIGWSFFRGKIQIAMVAFSRCSLVRGRLYSVSGKTVLKSGWLFIRGVGGEGFYCTM